MRFLNSLFWQLYLSIIGALVLIALLFITMMVYIDEQTMVEDFHLDIKRASQPIMLAWRETHQADPELMRQVGDDHLFHISVLDDSSLQKRLGSYEIVSTVKNIEIYQGLVNDLLLSVQALPNSEFWLIISDLDVDPNGEGMSEPIRQRIEQEQREESQTVSIIQISGIGLLLLIGIVLMVLVQRIKRHIDGLTLVSNEWARGELTVKANIDAPAPLDQLALGLNKMADELNQTLAEQQVMTHAISHELRTPLSKLQLALSLLIRKYTDLKGEPLADDLLRYIDELEHLVNQILTFAKLNHLKEQQPQDRVNISKLVEERVNELKVLNTEKQISISCQKDVQIEGDLFNIQLALDNILKNAIKYANQIVQVSVMLESSQNQVCITIEDDGPGIPIEQRKTILMPFARVDESRNRQSGGYGLGLAIVDAIARHYDGDIQLAESALGGLSLSITLPSST